MVTACNVAVFEKRPPGTAADLKYKDIKYKISAMFVQPEQKPNRITNAHCYSVCTPCTNVVRSFFLRCYCFSYSA